MEMIDIAVNICHGYILQFRMKSCTIAANCTTAKTNKLISKYFIQLNTFAVATYAYMCLQISDIYTLNVYIYIDIFDDDAYIIIIAIYTGHT